MGGGMHTYVLWHMYNNILVFERKISADHNSTCLLKSRKD